MSLKGNYIIGSCCIFEKMWICGVGPDMNNCQVGRLHLSVCDCLEKQEQMAAFFKLPDRLVLQTFFIFFYCLISAFPYQRFPLEDVCIEAKPVLGHVHATLNKNILLQGT